MDRTGETLSVWREKKGTMYHDTVSEDHLLLCNRCQTRQLPMRASRQANQRSEGVKLANE